SSPVLRRSHRCHHRLAAVVVAVASGSLSVPCRHALAAANGCESVALRRLYQCGHYREVARFEFRLYVTAIFRLSTPRCQALRPLTPPAPWPWDPDGARRAGLGSSLGGRL